MRRPYQILMPLLSLMFNRVDLTDLYPLQLEVKLVKFIDADTVEVQHNKKLLRVRLSKVDAPEKKQPWLKGEGSAGMEALNCAKRVVGNKQSFILKIEKTDIYGRLLGDLDEVSFELIKAGCVSLYPFTTFENKREKGRFLRAWLEARHSHRGLWSGSGYLEPKAWRKLSKRGAPRQWRR